MGGPEWIPKDPSEKITSQESTAKSGPAFEPFKRPFVVRGSILSTHVVPLIRRRSLQAGGIIVTRATRASNQPPARLVEQKQQRNAG